MARLDGALVARESEGHGIRRAGTRPRSGSVPDPIRADVYSLGALAWFLLTSQERKGTTQLPSEFSRDLAPWDSFIDGCCRSNPARRFESVTTAIRSLDGFATPDHPARAAQTIPQALPVTSSGPQINDTNGRAVGPEKTRLRGNRRIRWVAVGVLLAVVALGVYLRREKVAELFPPASGFLLPYQRGFGDTILKYKDRSYEGSAWRKLAEAQALDAAVEGHQRFSGLTGWDADNFVVVTQGAFGPVSVLRMRGGSWQVFARLTSSHANGNAACPRLLDADTLVVACGYYGYFFGKVTLGGVEDYGEVLQGQNNQPYTIPVDRDLFFFTATHSHDLGQAAKFEGGKQTKLDRSKHKNAFGHGEGNVPLTEYPVHGLTLSASYRAGRAVALCQPFPSPPILAECRDGIWYRLEALTEGTKYNQWLHKELEAA
jgi:hypothetical protein